MIEFSHELQQKLKAIGQTNNAGIFVEALDEMKRYLSDTRTLEKGRDANAQIEGRNLMCDMLDSLTGLISKPRVKRRTGEVDDFT